MTEKLVSEREQVIALVEGGASQRAAAREVGISQSTARRAIAELGRASASILKAGNFEPADFEEGMAAIHASLIAKVAERIGRDVDDIKPSELRDLAVSFGILDDKLYGRGNGSGVSVTNATQIIIKTEWPEP